MRDILLVHCANGRERGKNRIAVIGATPTVQFAVLDDRLPGAQIFVPTVDFGLLVEMPVEQDARFIRGILNGTGNFNEQQWRTPGQAVNFHLHAGQGVFLAPFGGQLRGFFDMAVSFPVGIEDGRFGWNTNIVLQSGNDIPIPGVLAELLERFSVHKESLV